ncbi:MAG: phosphatidate cytidylyltransferase [Chloroherpetonaceae bacterium]|nr:phosphatidate cytidylyltransferase [Chloroherpetonaceae bacterium]
MRMTALLALFGLSPFWNNVLISAIMVVYVFSLVALLNFCVVRLGLAPDLSRKITHIGAGCLVLFLALLDDSHWSKYLNITILVIWFFLLIQKGFFADENDEAVKIMTRTGDRTELLKGPFYFVIVSIICATVFYKTFAGVAAMGFLTFGDGLAPVIGTRMGKLKYHLLSQKSIEGSLTMLVAGIIGAAFFVWVVIPQELNFARLMALGAIATLVEAVSPKEIDNFLIPIGVIGFSYAV